MGPADLPRFAEAVASIVRARKGGALTYDEVVEIAVALGATRDEAAAIVAYGLDHDLLQETTAGIWAL